MSSERHPVVEEDLQTITQADLPWERLQGSVVLISGAYGFINAYLVETLLYLNETRPGFDVRVLAMGRDPGKAQKRFAAYPGRSDLRFLCQDVCAPAVVDGAVDYIIHGASWASPKYYGKYPADVLAPNVFGTRELLELARKKGSRGLLFLSSAENYGALDPAQIPIKETELGQVDPTAVRSCYAESKRMGETMCVAWHHQHDVPTKIARIFHTYGPGMALDDGRVFADFVANVVEGRDIVMKSDGRAVRAFCYLADAAHALFRVLLQGNVAEPYNVGNDEGVCSISELAQILARAFPGRVSAVVQSDSREAGYLKSEVDRTIPDTQRLRGLGWRPVWDVESGFKRTVHSYMPAGWNAKESAPR